jgi:hypothetical protein
MFISLTSPGARGSFGIVAQEAIGKKKRTAKAAINIDLIGRKPPLSHLF